MDNYLVVNSEFSGEYSEKHSRFIGFLIPCGNDEQAAGIISAKRKEFWDARHVVYAYVLADGTARFSDDGEPHGTAGKPVLDVLKSSSVKNAIIIVVRYFGGILLGTGGLVRAYTAAATAAINNSEKFKVYEGQEYSLVLPYGDYDRFVFLAKEQGITVTNTDYKDNVQIEFSVKDESVDTALNRIKDAFSSSVVPKFIQKTEIFEKI